jgi:hypothetical protein
MTNSQRVYIANEGIYATTKQEKQSTQDREDALQLSLLLVQQALPEA